MTALRNVSLAEAAKTARCGGCRRPIRKDSDPSFTMRGGVIVEWKCSRCQTAEDRAEITINEATLDYSTIQTDTFGRVTVRAKGEGRR